MFYTTLAQNIQLWNNNEGKLYRIRNINEKTYTTI